MRMILNIDGQLKVLRLRMCMASCVPFGREAQILSTVSSFPFDIARRNRTVTKRHFPLHGP